MKWVNFDDPSQGLERSQFASFGVVSKCVRVLKWVNLMMNHRGLERGQILMICHTACCDGPERSQFALISCIPLNCQLLPGMKGLERSQCALFTEFCFEMSWKESVCVATQLIALIPAVLSILYGDVLLYLWLSCLCLGCMGDILLGSMVNSLLCSMGISPLSMGVSLGCWVLMGSMADSPLLCSMGISPLSMGVSLGCWDHLGCLSTGCLAQYCWCWISLVMQVLLIVSPFCLWLISCLKQNLRIF